MTTRIIQVTVPALLMGVTLIALSGCAAHTRLQPSPGQEIRDWARPTQFPAWIDAGSSLKDGRFSFVGVVDRAAREDFGRTDARENARIMLARDLADRIQTEYGTAREGGQSQFIHDVATSMADATVRGAIPGSWYTEHHHVQPEPGAPVREVFYKVWVRMEMSLEDFRSAKQRALEVVATGDQDAEGRRIYEELKARAASPAWPYRSE